MTFKKPDVRYVDMAKYIDDTVYTDSCDDTTVYEYLYHLINMLAHKQNFFTTSQLYDCFAIRSASNIFLRLKSPKQFEYDEDGTPKLDKIVSILNYLKKVIYPLKVDFEQENYAQVITQDKDAKISKEYSFNLNQVSDLLNVSEFNLCLGDTVQTVKQFLMSLPYSPNSVEWQNIYLSCMLTFLNSITLSNKSKNRLTHLDEIGCYKDYLLEDLLAMESEDPVVLYHLDESMHDYIAVLTNRIKHTIANDLTASLHTHIPSDANVKSMLLSSIYEYKDETY